MKENRNSFKTILFSSALQLPVIDNGSKTYTVFVSSRNIFLYLAFICHIHFITETAVFAQSYGNFTSMGKKPNQTNIWFLRLCT